RKARLGSEIAPDDRGAGIVGVEVRVDRVRELRIRRGTERPLGRWPSVVRALGDDVELLPGILTDVGAEQATVAREPATIRIAESVAPDLPAGARLSDERVVARH